MIAFEFRLLLVFYSSGLVLQSVYTLLDITKSLLSSHFSGISGLVIHFFECGSLDLFLLTIISASLLDPMQAFLNKDATNIGFGGVF